ncbi:MAG: SpoIID/LytB domain-containing protein [Deltaproteobacteria bacterium]|nr:SpoIID/LytB domain-containing protein [Deltaproteobacteria bacterium]
MNREPIIRVGIAERCRTLEGRFNGAFHAGAEPPVSGPFAFRAEGDVIIAAGSGTVKVPRREIRFTGGADATFTVIGVTIGVNFHWERKQEQSFKGDLTLIAQGDGTLTAINEVPLETYLASVISSEMKATAPVEFLKAHAVTSRSWLAAMLERGQRPSNHSAAPTCATGTDSEIIRWYDREDHELFDVCADDHCQRYHGLDGVTETAAAAVQATQGQFLVYGNKICDARYYKACGGLTENFETAWEDTPRPYLASVADSASAYPPIRTEEDAQRWILSAPHAWCNTADRELLRQILPAFDQETRDFFRWRVKYERRELEEILREKSGIDFGTLRNLVSLTRGPSGRISRLRIEGSKATVTVGKELEIRRWLSRSHLLSSAFVISTEAGSDGIPARFVINGAGWGHGVGLCQIGAAVMAAKGFSAEEILRHYFRGVELKKLY